MTSKARRHGGFMAASIRSKSSPAFFTTSIPQAGTEEAGDLENVTSCDDLIDLRKLKNKDDLAKVVLSIAQKVLPDWKSATQVELDRVSGAMTNAVYFMSAPDRPRVLLRVYGIGAEQLVDRQHELEWLARLSRMSTSLSPQLLAKFGNGRFEEYLESTTLTHADLHNPDISCQIAQCLRELHDVTEEYPPPTENCRVEVWRNISQWYAYARELLNQEEWKEKLKPLALDTALPKEIELCKAYMHRQDVPQSPVIFTHNDAQYGNVLRVEKTGELVLVDFEYAGYNPRGFDIANHFSEWMYDYHGPSPASYDVDKYPTEEEQLRFITAYIEAGDDANKDLLDPKELQQDALRWAMVVHLHWSLWGLVQASQSEIDYDYFLYFTERLKGFRKGLERALEQNTNSSSA